MTDLKILEKWILQIEERKKQIEKLETSDRLALTSSITYLHNSIIGSLEGWSHWLKNPPVMNQLTEKDLKEAFDVFKKLAIEFLDLDVKMSTKVLKKQKKKRKKKIKTKQTYVT